MKKTITFLIVVFLITLVIPLAYYIYIFCNQNISDKSSNWGEFGSYISALISFCNLSVFIILTLQIQRYNEKESQHTKNLQKPILSFTKKNDNSNFIMENIGAGTALNIRVKSDYQNNLNIFNNEIECYSLRSGCVDNNEWSDKINIIVAQYNDIFDNKYYSYFENNHLLFFSEIDGAKKFPLEFKKAKRSIIKFTVEK